MTQWIRLRPEDDFTGKTARKRAVFDRLQDHAHGAGDFN